MNKRIREIMQSRSANADRDRRVSAIHKTWYESNPRKKNETEEEYLARQSLYIYNKDLHDRQTEKDIKVGSGKKSKRRKTRSRKTRRYRK